MQYLSSTAVVRVDWGKMATRFENRFFKKDPDGTSRAPTVYSLLKCVVNFLVADFQQRASFVAGFALGMRFG
jgi:FUN14 domain-containing protein 1